MIVSRADLGLAAIVSGSVAEKRSPILFACKDEPARVGDSGWQFWGHPDVDNGSDPKVWRLDEVLELEPTLAIFIHSLPGIFLQRKNVSAQWEISELPPEEAANERR